jgi:hypothetical protein
MAIKYSSKIWRETNQQGTRRLVLLALADYANDQGMAWPSIASLAQKCRLSERQTQRILRILEKDGEIIIRKGGTNNTFAKNDKEAHSILK